jgi:hypothetical protein
MPTAHPLALDIIRDVLSEVAPNRLQLLLEIISIEELHLTDKSSVAQAEVAAAIEKVAKTEARLST